MPDDLEKRIRLVEDDHKEQKLLYQHMSKTLDSISADIRTALDIKGKVDDHAGQLKKLWDKIDTVQALKEEFNLVKTEHAACRPKVDTLDDHASGCDYRLRTLEEKVGNFDKFISGRFTNLVDKFLPWAMAIFAFYAVTKGWVKP